MTTTVTLRRPGRPASARSDRARCLKADDAKRLKELERENGKLKRMVADQLLEIDALKEVAKGKLVSPSRGREAVQMLQQRSRCLSGGRAGSRVSTAPPSVTSHDEQTATPLCVPGCGSSRASIRAGAIGRRGPALREEGWAANRKKIQRLWREEGLRVPRRKRKRQRLGTSTAPAARLRANGPITCGRLTFSSTRPSRAAAEAAPVVDEHTREALAIEVERRIDADHTVRVLDRIVARTAAGPSWCGWTTGPS